MSPTYGDADEESCVRAIRTALDAGITMIDTADLYGRGHNESLVGRALRGRRQDAFLCTKFGFRFRTGEQSEERYVDSSPLWAKRACDASLQRLGVERIDLLYLHRRNPEIPVEETVGAMGALVDDGKVAHIGLSEISPQTLVAAAATRPIAAVQMEYSLFTRDVEEGMHQTCRDVGAALVAYAPIGRGWLTGSVPSRGQMRAGDARLTHPRFSEEAYARNRQLVARVSTIADRVDADVSQVALAWLLSRGEDIIPIPGTTNPEHVLKNADAATVDLTPAQLSYLDDAIPPGAAHGARHNLANLRDLGR